MADATSSHVDAGFDPRTFRIEGVAIHGNTRFSCTYISKIDETLWVGGCSDGLPLPLEIEYVVSLYPSESYECHNGVKGFVEEKLFDANLEDTARLFALADVVNGFRRLGPTLVHCQAGLNRSGLIAALAIVRDGESQLSPREAVELVRSKRSPAVLCNPDFERFLLEDVYAS